MKRRAGLLIVVLLSLCGIAQAAPATPEEVLKGKGLSKVGAFYLLEGDIKLPEKLRAMRAAKFRVDDHAAKRMKLERDIDSAKASYLQCTRDALELNGQLQAAQKQGTFKYNEIIGRIRDLDAARQDEQVKTALAAINQRGGLKLRLGPSPLFLSELPGIRKLRDTVREAVIKLTMDSGTPSANVMLNNKVSVLMTVDTGAASMTITSQTAKQLGLKINASNATIKTVNANGKVTEARLVVLESVRLGQFVVENVECWVYPPDVDGSNLLGGTFLRNFVSRMDLAVRELHLTQVAGTPSPSPAAAVAAKPTGADSNLSALEKHDRAVREAQDSYVRAVLAAKTEFLRDVAEEIKKARDDPETLKRLEAAKKEIEDDLAVANFHSGGKLAVQINAVDDWKEVAPVRKGEVLEITASGSWTPNVKVPNTMYGPQGFANGAYLQGKIGDKVYRINTGITIKVESDGVLSMRMEDSIRSDNGGFVTVTISRKAE